MNATTVFSWAMGSASGASDRVFSVGFQEKRSQYQNNKRMVSSFDGMVGFYLYMPRMRPESKLKNKPFLNIQRCDPLDAFFDDLPMNIRWQARRRCRELEGVIAAFNGIQGYQTRHALQNTAKAA